jgi:hypothetical protein
MPILRGSLDRDNTVAETGFRQATLETAVDDMINGHFDGDIIGFWRLHPAAGVMGDGTLEVLDAVGKYSRENNIQPSMSSRYLLDQYGIGYWIDQHTTSDIAEGRRIADHEHWADMRAGR